NLEQHYERLWEFRLVPLQYLLHPALRTTLLEMAQEGLQGFSFEDNTDKNGRWYAFSVDQMLEALRRVKALQTKLQKALVRRLRVYVRQGEDLAPWSVE